MAEGSEVGCHTGQSVAGSLGLGKVQEFLSAACMFSPCEERAAVGNPELGRAVTAARSGWSTWWRGSVVAGVLKGLTTCTAATWHVVSFRKTAGTWVKKPCTNGPSLKCNE